MEQETLFQLETKARKLLKTCPRCFLSVNILFKSKEDTYVYFIIVNFYVRKAGGIRKAFLKVIEAFRNGSRIVNFDVYTAKKIPSIPSPLIETDEVIRDKIDILVNEALNEVLPTLPDKIKKNLDNVFLAGSFINVDARVENGLAVYDILSSEDYDVATQLASFIRDKASKIRGTLTSFSITRTENLKAIDIIEEKDYVVVQVAPK